MKQNTNMQLLDANDKVLINKIASWYFNEWDTPVEKTVNRLANYPDDDVLVLLVLYIDGKAIGSGGICTNVNLLTTHERFRQYTPWVALLYTEEKYRGLGYGKMLMDQLEHHAKEIGLSKIYLYTSTAESLYKRCGWTEIERIIYKGQDTVVMEKEIQILNPN